jgi:hypothetical protein
VAKPVNANLRYRLTRDGPNGRETVEAPAEAVPKALIESVKTTIEWLMLRVVSPKASTALAVTLPRDRLHEARHASPLCAKYLVRVFSDIQTFVNR